MAGIIFVINTGMGDFILIVALITDVVQQFFIRHVLDTTVKGNSLLWRFCNKALNLKTTSLRQTFFRFFLLNRNFFRTFAVRRGILQRSCAILLAFEFRFNVTTTGGGSFLLISRQQPVVGFLVTQHLADNSLMGIGFKNNTIFSS